MGKYKQSNGRKLLRLVLFLVFLGMILLSGWKLYEIYQMYAVGRENYGSMTDQYVAVVTEPETQPTAMEETEPREYAPIQVDFDKLREEGPEIVGWLYSEDTPINYPLVYHQNNSYYLDRLPSGKFSAGGSIFMECTNNPDFSDLNTIFYGHNMNDDSMFGSLAEYRKQEYYEMHPTMYLLTPEKDYRLDLIGGYTTPSVSDTYSIPADKAEWAYLVQKAEENTEFEPIHQAQPGERLVTLSTCSYVYDDARFVLVGVLRELDRRPVEADIPEEKT